MIHLSRRHLCRPALRGPAERVLVGIWLSDLTGLVLNAYPDVHPGAHPDVREHPAPRWSIGRPAGVAALPRRPALPDESAQAA